MITLQRELDLHVQHDLPLLDLYRVNAAPSTNMFSLIYSLVG